MDVANPSLLLPYKSRSHASKNSFCFMRKLQPRAAPSLLIEVFPMAGRSNKHMVGLIRVGKDPEWSESKTIAESQGKQVDVRERTYWEKNVDKQTGSYTKFTGKDTVVSGERFVEKSTGRVGYKDEYEKSSNIKIGDNDGYTEYYREEKVKRVIYGKNSKNKAITNYPYPKYNKY